MSSGYLSLVLHAHLPYVRHPEQSTVAERWLWEALTESYIPLLQVFFRLAREKVPFRLTLSLSPPLISMLGDFLLQDRYLQHLNHSLELGAKEIERNRGNSQLKALAEFYQKRLIEVKKFYEYWDRDLIYAFRVLSGYGCIDLITTAATHGYLPLMATNEAVKAQVMVAAEFFEKWFGFHPKGLWLPECGYKPGIEKILADCGIGYFFVESHALQNASPPGQGVHAPLLLPSGLAAFGRDPESSRQVWSAREGYPGDFCYREFYRDIGFELSDDYLRPYLPPEGIRVDTGFKYYRITGEGEKKEFYEPEKARERAYTHAGHFLFCREKQVEYLASKMPFNPVVVAPYDAELFGHWWFEGPIWLEEFIRRVPLQQQFSLATPGDYLEKAKENAWELPNGVFPECSWGLEGYHKVWLGPDNDWIYRHLHLAERRMVDQARLFTDPDDLQRRVLNQMGRELLLAQSSDWAFIMHMGTVVGYARQRLKDHIGRFALLYHQLRNKIIDEETLTRLEWLDPIFPYLDYNAYVSDDIKSNKKTLSQSSKKTEEKRVLMLSWEYPPRSIGGLGRHVFGLTKALAEAGQVIDILTPWVPGTPTFFENGPLRVHRVRIANNDQDDFLSWVFNLNIALAAYGGELIRENPEIDLIHAHDWLVAYAAVSLKQTHQIPLLATIHATEHGRNNGIHSNFQKKIHSLEWWLIYEAWRVICCSSFMQKEILQVFQTPEDKIDVIHNGIDIAHFCIKTSGKTNFCRKFVPEGAKIILYVGRLVREKGVQTLIQAAPSVVSKYPEAYFIICGRGPYRQELEELTKKLGMEKQVIFAGYIDDYLRDQIYLEADLAVFPSLYEPFGIVALEAMASGLPVIVSDVGGFREIINDGSNGWRFPAGNPSALANIIKNVFKNEKKARAVGDKGILRASEFLWSKIALETLKTYQRVRNEAGQCDWVVKRCFKRPDEVFFFKEIDE